MKLLVDIGNSRLKWVTAVDARLSHLSSLDHHESDFSQQLLAAWTAIDPPRQLALASVAKSALLSQVADLAADLWPGIRIHIAQTKAQAGGLSNGYRHYAQLGVDRWLAMLAAQRHYPGKLCIVDCGTAITLDVVNHGHHRGGLICPGLGLMRKSLLNDTAAALACNELDAGLQLADHSASAVANGTLLAAVALIHQTLSSLEGDYRLLLTGGDAQTLATALNRAVIVDTFLVLKGLLLSLDEENQE